LSQLPDLRLVYEAWTEIQRSNLVGFLSDEEQSTQALEGSLDSLADRLVRLAGTGYIKPRTFLGKAGMKVFRDDVWGGLRVIFRADHKAYKQMGVYDFPHNKIGKRILTALAWLVTGLPGIKKRFPAMIKGQMIKTHKKVLDNA
jgi:hypothetical protein